MNVEALLALVSVLGLMARTGAITSDKEVHQIPLTSWVWFGTLSLLLLITAAFWHATHFYFLSDDFVLLKVANDSSPGDFRTLFAVEKGYGFYRPIAKLSLALNAE